MQVLFDFTIWEVGRREERRSKTAKGETLQCVLDVVVATYNFILW